MLYFKAKKFEEEFNTCKKALIGMAFEESNIQEMDDRSFHVVQNCLRLMDDSIELMLEEAEAIDSINGKLDKLLNMMEKES